MAKMWLIFIIDFPSLGDIGTLLRLFNGPPVESKGQAPGDPTEVIKIHQNSTHVLTIPQMAWVCVWAQLFLPQH